MYSFEITFVPIRKKWAGIFLQSNLIRTELVHVPLEDLLEPRVTYPTVLEARRNTPSPLLWENTPEPQTPSEANLQSENARTFPVATLLNVPIQPEEHEDIKDAIFQISL